MMRKRMIFSAVLAAAFFVCAAPAFAQSHLIAGGDNEFGVILGEPSGLSFKSWTSWNKAIDLGLAWSFQDKGYFHIHADYLFHDFDAIEVDNGSFPYYFGIGARAGFADEDTVIGMRLVIGLEYLHEEYPVSFFGELAPVLDVIPETEFDMNGGIGVRMIF